MIIKYDSTPGRVCSFMQVIIGGYNHDDYCTKINDMGITVDKEIIDAFNYVWDGIEKTTPGLALFFTVKHAQNCYMTWKFKNLIWKFKSIDSFISYFEKMNRSELKRSILAYYDTGDYEVAYYDSILNDSKQLFNFINDLPMPITQKWEIMSFINNPEIIMESIIPFMNNIKTKVNIVFKRYSQKLRDFKNRINQKINQPGQFFLFKEFNELSQEVNLEKYEKIIMTFSFFNEILVYTTVHDATRYFYLGINYESLAEQHQTSIDPNALLYIFKALSDPNRLSILKMLLDNEMFVSEIADALNIRVSTASYHLDQLQYPGLLQSCFRGKQVYYSANKEFIKRWIHLLTVELLGVDHD